MTTAEFQLLTADEARQIQGGTGGEPDPLWLAEQPVVPHP
jgi:hypothetical protein